MYIRYFVSFGLYDWFLLGEIKVIHILTQLFEHITNIHFPHIFPLIYLLFESTNTTWICCQKVFFLKWNHFTNMHPSASSVLLYLNTHKINCMVFLQNYFQYISLPSFWHTATNFLLTATHSSTDIWKTWLQFRMQTFSKASDWRYYASVMHRRHLKYHRQLDVGRVHMRKTQVEQILSQWSINDSMNRIIRCGCNDSLMRFFSPYLLCTASLSLFIITTITYNTKHELMIYKSEWISRI